MPLQVYREHHAYSQTHKRISHSAPIHSQAIGDNLEPQRFHLVQKSAACGSEDRDDLTMLYDILASDADSVSSLKRLFRVLVRIMTKRRMSSGT